MRFNVTVPVKPYVKRFLINNYGEPVNFHGHPRENEMFLRMLRRPNAIFDYKYKKEFFLHTENVFVSISENDFYKNGWELTRTDIISFGKHFEQRAKWLMRTVVGTYTCFGTPINVAVFKFQKKFSMEEEYWPYESIIKDYQRLNEKNNIKNTDYAFNHLEHLILINMTKIGVITSHVLNSYEKYDSASD
jgi:hypothetical protein